LRSPLHYFIFHFAWLRESACFFFGKNQFPVQCYLKNSTAGGDELQRLDIVFKPVKYAFRQTDGFGKVTSCRAVFNGNSYVLGHFKKAPFVKYLFKECPSLLFDILSLEQFFLQKKIVYI